VIRRRERRLEAEDGRRMGGGVASLGSGDVRGRSVLRRHHMILKNWIRRILNQLIYYAVNIAELIKQHPLILLDFCYL
jgi:hypothetical protein